MTSNDLNVCVVSFNMKIFDKGSRVKSTWDYKWDCFVGILCIIFTLRFWNHTMTSVRERTLIWVNNVVILTSKSKIVVVLAFTISSSSIRLSLHVQVCLMFWHVQYGANSNMYYTLNLLKQFVHFLFHTLTYWCKKYV